MAPKAAGKKTAAAADGASKKQRLAEKKSEAVRREQKQVLSSDKANQAIMMEQIVEWCESHPRGFEHIHRSIMLGSYDALDQKNALTDADADTRLPSYMNKFRLLTVPVALEILALVTPAVASFIEKMLKKGQKISKFDVTEVVAFVLHVDLRSALPSKQKSQLLQWCKTRSEESDSPLKSWSSSSEPVCETWEDGDVLDFVAHPLYKYWNFEHAADDGDQSTFGVVRYLKTDIRLRLPKEIRGFPMKGPHLFFTAFVKGCISIPMTHVMEHNGAEAGPERPLFFEAVPSGSSSTSPSKPKEAEQQPPPATPKRKARSDPKTPGSGRSGKDPVSPPPSSGKRKRCLAIIIEHGDQVHRWRIFYGNRVHYLCTKAGISDVRQIMGTMAHVVEAMLERLRVDLTEDEIAVALQVFNLRLWQETNRQQELVDSTRKLCDMLKLSHGEIAKSRNLASEKVKALGHPGLSDTFWTFAKTVQLLKVEKVQDGEEQNLRYNNTLYNKALHQAATAAVAVLRGPSGPVEKAARRLELEFGRGILSSQYSKLSKLLSLTNKLASATRNAVDLTAWMIDSLTLALRMNMVTPAKCTEKFLDRDRKTGDAGFWLSRMLVVQVFDYAAKLANKLPEPDKVKLTGILAELRCPSTCWEKYLCHADADQGAAGEDDMDGEDPEDVERPVPQSKIGAVKEGFNKAIGMLLDLLLELMSGKYYKDCCMLASSEDGLAKALTAAQLGSSDDTEHEEPCALITQMKIIVDKFDNSTKSVGATSAAPAPSLLQSLAKASEADTPEECVERERQWKAVQTERRKFVSFSVPNKISKDCLVNAFRGCGKVFTHKGTLNSSHRLIVASADLLAEAGTDPWLKGTPPSEEWKEICAFAKDISGPEDFVVLFDGRMREIRRVSEDLLLNQQHTEECTIVYSGGCPPRTGRTRRVPLAAKKVETGAVKFPVARTKIQTTKKGSFTVCGEASTYQGTYSGVEYRAVSEMPLVSADTKKKIIAPATTGDLPTPPEDWQDRHGSDVPLFWNESKPIAYWNAIIEEFCAEAVFDLTAGTGALMEASLTAGIAYHGLCSLNKEHMSWVQAVADRAACGMMALEGSTLYSDENAKAVKKHFPHVLESLSNQDDQDEAYQTPLGQNQSQDGFSSDAPGSLRKQAVKDGLVPKARRAFVIWFQENSEVKKGAPKHEFLNEMKHLGAVWQGMTDKQKAPFMARSKDEFMAQRSALAVLGIRMRGSTTSAGGPDEAKDPPAADESGGRVGPFELNGARAPIGGGAYGSVYSCQHPQSGLNVAVKVYRGSDGPADCRHEVEQMKLLMKAVPQQKMMWFPLLVSSGVTGRPWPWMATSLCGPSLATALRNPAAHGKPRTWSVAAQLRSALQTLHDAGILHLDVKPGNVLWCPCTDQVQVCDFGMSENMARLQKASQAPRFLQYVTAAYRPPELWPARVNGDGDCGVRKQLLTAAVDMWAYACVVFEVETGNPFMPKGEAGLRAWCKQWPELWKTRSDLANCPAASHTCCTKVLRAGKWGLFVLVGCAPDPGKRRWPELCLNQK
ncbi:MPK1 [Symbiodinium sp. CCMP2592]|nr:MPK1 [Symbiodinium sp. CCMP2592]